mgnify:CR=1 FL=1
MIKFSAESILKAKTGQRVGLLCQTGSKVVNVKEKFLFQLENYMFSIEAWFYLETKTEGFYDGNVMIMIYFKLI